MFMVCSFKGDPGGLQVLSLFFFEKDDFGVLGDFCWVDARHGIPAFAGMTGALLLFSPSSLSMSILTLELKKDKEAPLPAFNRLEGGLAACSLFVHLPVFAPINWPA
jgi:hypothetical protein